ncbi:MAG: glycosyltransferase family 4 protein [Lachnospiraceae bacterium]|nr:glycosyltransferase family 4 protein [Lachnospiraceae bacterium]
MKKALIVTAIGGFLPQFELNDVKILQDYGFQVHYASNFTNNVYSLDQAELKNKGIHLHHIDIEKSPFAARHNMRAFQQIRKIIREENITLVHCHNPVGALVGRLAAHYSKEKPYTIYTAHGFHFYKGAPLKNWLFYYPVEKWLARKTDLLITINREDFERGKKFQLKSGGKVERIYGVGVDMKKFRKKQEKNLYYRKKIGIPAGAFHIVTAAELNENKNQKVVIEAIKLLGRKDVYYTICGKGKNKERLEKMIREYGLEKQVKLLGYRTDIADILQTADCFAFPSIREGLGIAAIEALAVEVPLLVADNRGTKEYTKDDYNGIVCEAGDAVGFKNAIERLYTDYSYRGFLSRHCREIAERFSVEATDKVMRRIYGEVASKLRGEVLLRAEENGRQAVSCFCEQAEEKTEGSAVS